MDLLISVIGNAVLDSVFREHLLKDPVTALDDWGFRLTKHETGALVGMMAGKEDLESKFKVLEDILYKRFEEAPSEIKTICTTKRCFASVYPGLTGLRADLRKAAQEELIAEEKKGKAAA